MIALIGLFFLFPQSEPVIAITPNNPIFTANGHVTTITYKEPYEAFIQYSPSEESVTTDTEYLLLLLTEDWENAYIDFALDRGIDSVGGEHLAIARVVDDKYEIRAYQNVGQDYFVYVTASCAITEFSLDEIYAGIGNIIRKYEKDNREINLS